MNKDETGREAGEKGKAETKGNAKFGRVEKQKNINQRQFQIMECRHYKYRRFISLQPFELFTYFFFLIDITIYFFFKCVLDFQFTKTNWDSGAEFRLLPSHVPCVCPALGLPVDGSITRKEKELVEACRIYIYIYWIQGNYHPA